MAMTASIVLTDEQEAFARRLVEEGRYPDIGAVLGVALEYFRFDRDGADEEVDPSKWPEEDRAALRELLEQRLKGPFVDLDEGEAEIDAMLAGKLRDSGAL